MPVLNVVYGFWETQKKEKKIRMVLAPLFCSFYGPYIINALRTYARKFLVRICEYLPISSANEKKRRNSITLTKTNWPFSKKKNFAWYNLIWRSCGGEYNCDEREREWERVMRRGQHGEKPSRAPASNSNYQRASGADNSARQKNSTDEKGKKWKLYKVLIREWMNEFL